ncbi:hypothetical protein BU25DRAFT_457765 [Macroventuria anomochaeta]|uniref:Uncharacterized protein n=1 Tax=Macroventuria anomochaeta TaxID=301207 RepID=A0ACB6S2E1_9PLEO|nr:uncharacterized protein BU25DRAFT_457765 [Macroventuria anomochaeta]KAF2628446.1 hypothetical protein BU25DRAFT_457765 [Macroventuria anomochaeta]
MPEPANETAKHSTAQLFNNPALSNVKIRQIYEAQVRKYDAKKSHSLLRIAVLH